MLTRLARLSDRRLSQGRRPPPSYVLAVAASADPTGARFLTTLAERTADAPDRLPLLCTLHNPDWTYRAPHDATVRRVLQRIDADALDTAIGGWHTTRVTASRVADKDG